jgi:glycosidase
MLRPSRFTLPALAASLVALAAVACGDPIYVDEDPPTGVGGYVPTTTSSGAYGYGANTGEGGSIEPPPPECDDADKRCALEITYENATASSVRLHGDFAPDGWTVGVPMTKTGSTWAASIQVPWDGAVQYKFSVDGSTTWIEDPANPNKVDDGFGGFNSVTTPITCPDEFVCAPPLLGDFDWRDAVLYFVMIDRFQNGNTGNDAPVSGVQGPANFQGGDFAGLLQKIEEDYFQSIGVNALWISVPMDNADIAGQGNDGYQYSAYHGYWPTDLTKVESRLGTLADLQAVVDAAHARDIKVVVDYAMNHVHSSSPIYQQNPGWFWPNQNGGGNCVCGEGCSWDGAEGRRCWFTSYLPDFNFTNPQARDYSVSNAIGWVKDLGLDGFRLDAVKHIEDQWLLDLRSRIKSEVETETQQHFYMVGETYTGDKGTIKYYVNPSTMLDGQFDFPLRAEILRTMLIKSGPMSDLGNFLANNVTYYGNGIMSTFIGNHDIPRTIHFAQDNPLWSDPWAGGKDRAWTNTPGLPSGTNAFERMATAFTVIFTIPGVPLVYYGDEIGLPGAGDPDNRRFMQWSGYTAGQTLLKTRLTDLARIRSEHPALRKGTWSSVSATADTLAYRMQDPTETVYVLLNRSDSTQTVSGLPSQAFLDEVSGQNVSGPSIQVPARSARILVSP